jgi:DNA repair exonuclease SbcCD ATPase subunit
MNIRITRIALTNFKCFRSKEITLSDDITTIRGRNGVGKTTIADAILFCLFGKNTAGQSDLELFKTLENGSVIPHLDHSVELELCIPKENGDGNVYINLRRTIKENWIKRRGSDETVFKNNTTDYFVNGESYTAADYKKYIASLISEDVFRAITNPNYFPSIKWQEQRQFLESMAGNIEVPADTPELKALVEQMAADNEDIVAYRKHLSYQIKEIKKKLDLIPTRLEEQNKALPALQDWDTLTYQSDELSRQIKEVDDAIFQIKTGGSSNAKREKLRKQSEEVTLRMKQLYDQTSISEQSARSAHNKLISEASMRFNEALNNQRLMEQTIAADERLINRCHEINYEAELQKLRDQWPSSRFVISEDLRVCPTCGQPIPDEQFQAKVEEMRRNFNLAREAKIKDLNERAAIIKRDQQESVEEENRLKQKLEDDRAQLEAIKNSINEAFADKARLEKQKTPTLDELLAENAEYAALSKQFQELKDALANVSDDETDPQQLATLEQQRSECSEVLLRCQQQLATRQQYDRITSLIESINTEQKDLIRQLSELERREDVARDYQDRQNNLLESTINDHFSLVRWRLTRTVNNAGDSFEEPFCECYVNGVAYHSGLNQAARLNAGLDIVNALCRHYNVSAPIVLDNAESTINIIPTIGQQLRLQVFDSDFSLA